MDALDCLGFLPDTTAIVYDGPVLSLDFGNLILRASCCMNLRAAQIVLFTGVISTPRTLGQVHFELPRRVESVKQCAALIVWNLDQFSEFRKNQHIPWVEEARINRRLLPWVLSMAEWNARPQCIVKRDWLRLALKTLANYALTLPDDTDVLFNFDGYVLSIKCDGKVIALAGQGVPWGVSFKVPAGALRRLPKRLMREDIGISIWESSISIGNRTYPGTLDRFSSTDSSRIQ
jgi:hypothetical protein